MQLRRLEVEIELATPREEVFAFFTDPANLEALTPGWLRFAMVSPLPITMRAGVQIDYRLRLRGVPLRWTSEITVWEPPARFVDEQRRGPYRRWTHEHLFESRGERTLVRDRVAYAVAGGPLAPLVDRLLVRPDLERIFAYRHARLAERFGVAGG